jgi:hypothetical protein
MLKRALQMSHRDASPAVMQESVLREEEPPEKCLQLFVQAAAVRLVFLSSPAVADLYIAVNVSLRCVKSNFAMAREVRCCCAFPVTPERGFLW